MFFDKALTSTPEFAKAEKAVKTDTLPLAISGLSHFHKCHIACVLKKAQSLPMLFITDDENEAMKTASDMNALGINAVYLPSRDYNLQRAAAVSHEYENDRLFALCKAANGEADMIVCSVSAAIQPVPKKEILLSSSFTVKTGDTVNMDTLCEKLVNAGYVRSDLVEGAGQFSKRGGILDIFPSDAVVPSRIDFFGDEIDSIHTFDPDTQRRAGKADFVSVTPARELSVEASVLSNLLEQKLQNDDDLTYEARKILTDDIDLLNSTGICPSTDCYIPLLKDRLCTIFDYADEKVFVSEWARVKESFDGTTDNFLLQAETLVSIGGFFGEADDYIMSEQRFLSHLQKCIYLDSLLKSNFGVAPKELIGFSVRGLSPFNSTVSALADDISPLLMQNYSVVIATGSMKSANALSLDLRDLGINCFVDENPEKLTEKSVLITPLRLSQSGDYPSSRFSLISFGTAAVSRKKTGKKGKAIGGLEELHKGDTVVHSVHGIGIFDGVKKIDAGGVIKDYIKIIYANSDVLYIPVTQLDLVSKYVGASENSVRLSKLGSQDWQKTKAKVRSHVKDMAKELIALYAKRSKIKGYAFSPDSDMQRDFETRFEFDETEDQLRCTEEIKKDMEKPQPMDRLLCGDVGFGKTEVALRAAFKCISDCKQVAILVPTTILALQHYTTVCKRMECMGINAQFISRFKSKKQVDEILKDLKNGKIDIIIGTHRLVSNDIEFKDLGLLIIDEEQRFGVGQKEKIKEKYPFVDVLTLSATPIPRTLNMAMSGLRDMSIIEEAPCDRYPVQTFVLEDNPSLILDAIKRELRRGGQVYYLHNRTDDIQRKAILLQEKLPDAKISFADGKMSEEKLNAEWQKLIDRETDVLVCTTIIETGVDVPNVNTLIIEDADRFGLSQLHQIRGRVGRSNRRAYAYFTFKRGKAIGEVAAKRLEAVRDFTEFGSGFKIALRDLEIRGAGNVLGAEQHGQLESVGYDLYVKMLSEAVSEEKGEKVKESLECTVDLQINSHIPERYIESLEARLDVYRKIADIKTDEDCKAVEEELCDRFGKIPKSVRGLMQVSMLRNRAASLGIYEIVQRDDHIFFYIPSLEIEQVNRLYASLGKKRYVFGGKEKPYINVRMKKDQTPLDTMNEVLSIL